MIVYHKKYEYLLHRIGFPIVGAIEPKPGVPPSASHIADLIERLRGENVGAIILDPWNDRRVAEQIGKAIGAPVIELCPAVGACPNTDSVIALFEENIQKLIQAMESDE